MNIKDTVKTENTLVARETQEGRRNKNQSENEANSSNPSREKTGIGSENGRGGGNPLLVDRLTFGIPKE